MNKEILRIIRLASILAIWVSLVIILAIITIMLAGLLFL